MTTATGGGTREGDENARGPEGERDPAEGIAAGALVGDDGIARCRWGHAPADYRRYHDAEWGVPVRGERALFERLALEGFQAGLSWLTILRKREGFREAFEGFDPERVAGLTEADLDRLAANPAIVRHRGKIEATRRNARSVLALRERGGLDTVIWSHRPERTPLPRSPAEVPSRSPESIALSRALREAGMTFVGPTICHALMEAVGVIDTHLLGCHRRGASGLWRPDGSRREPSEVSPSGG